MADNVAGRKLSEKSFEEMKTYQIVPTGADVSTSVAKELQPEEEHSNEHADGDTNRLPATKVYARRWIMLFIFTLVSLANAFQWIQFAIITDVVMEYYQVSSTDVNWTSLIYMITYIPLIFPGAWIMDKLVSSRHFISEIAVQIATAI